MRTTRLLTILTLTLVCGVLGDPVAAQEAAGADVPAEGPAEVAPDPEVVVPAPVPTDSLPVTGDFNGVGRDTIFWYSPGTVDRRWQGKADRTFAEMEPSIAVGDYKPFTGDFDGDHRSDIFFWAPGPTRDLLWYGRADNTYDQAAVADAGSYVAALPGDFNGDGRTDIVWYKPGRTTMWRANADRSFTVTPLGVTNTYSPFVGDFNGDLRADIFWYAGGSAEDHIWYGQANYRFTGVRLAVDGHYHPLAGDYDGNGRTDVLWYQAGNAPDYLWWSTTAFTSQSITVKGTTSSSVSSTVIADDISGGDQVTRPTAPGSGRSIGPSGWVRTSAPDQAR